MANSTRQLRFNGILQANLEKIINDGVRFNLEKLAKCSQNIAKVRFPLNLRHMFSLISYTLQYKADNHHDVLKREYMTGKLLIQRLELNLVELQNVYQSMQNVDLDKKYEKQIILLRNEVTERIRSFTRANQTLESNNLDDSQLLNSDTPHSGNVGFQIQEDAVKLTDSREKLRRVEALKEDIQELNTLAVNLASLVGEQQQVVDNIENNVTIAADNIEDGTKSLIKVEFCCKVLFNKTLTRCIYFLYRPVLIRLPQLHVLPLEVQFLARLVPLWA